MTTLDLAIRESIDWNRHVRLPWSEDTVIELLCEAEDSIEVDGCLDAWGTKDGHFWRVYVGVQP